ncbi:hypothetical protein GCM10010267_08190 [Streptomyces griseorubens]|nr:hypothetical protein GCM10010267_08190 [Streptomyces griseorubens]
MPNPATGPMTHVEGIYPGHVIAAGVSLSGHGPQVAGWVHAVAHVKKSPPSRALVCTLGCRLGASCLVRRVRDWKRPVAACFDPSHRKAVPGSRRRALGAPAVAAFICPQRGAAPPL